MTSVVGLTELLNVTVTPAPGSIQDSNLAEVAGSAVDTGVGASGAGTQRVALSTDSSVKIAEVSTPITGSLSANGTLLSVDTLGYSSISVQLSGFWTCEVTFQASNDNVNWVNVQGYGFNSTMTATDTAVDNDIYMLPVVGRYFQIVVTAFQSGPINATAYLRTQSLAGIGEAALTQAMDQSTETPLNVTFEGVQGPGQQPAANSVPVTLSNENVLDKHFFGKAYTQTTTYLNSNMLLTPEQAAIDPGAPLDCLQYRSIYFQFNTGGNALAGNTVNANFLPEASNDLINWTNVSVFRLDGGSAVGVNEVRSINPVNYGVSAIFGTNLMMRYFRVRCSSFTSSSYAQFSTILRMTPLTYQTYAYANIMQQGAAGLPTGVANFNTANQTVSTTGGQLNGTVTPLIMGGSDRSVVRQEMLGAPINPAVTAYNFSGPWGRQMGVDAVGGVTVSGPMPFLAEDKTAPVNVRLERSTNGQDSVQDLLQQILVELKALSYYTRELPVTISSMNQTPNPAVFGNPMSMADDPENFFNDPTTFRYTKGN